MDAVLSSMSGAFTNAAANILEMISVVLPLGIAVFAVKIAVDTGKKFFEKISGTGRYYYAQDYDGDKNNYDIDAV